MPRGDGTGPAGRDPGTGKGLGRGSGRGRMGGRGLGAGEEGMASLKEEMEYGL